VSVPRSRRPEPWLAGEPTEKNWQASCCARETPLLEGDGAQVPYVHEHLARMEYVVPRIAVSV